MPETKKIDPFKPVQPSIPGVPARLPAATEVKAAADAKTAALHPPISKFQPAAPKKSIPTGMWVVIGLMIVVALGGKLLVGSFGSATQSQSSEPSAVSQPDPITPVAKPAEDLPLAPGVIATTSELATPWSAKRFLFRTPLSSDPVPAMVFHLPNGQYWGISMIEPFGTCQLEYITDLRVLANDYSFRANHPMVGDPCTHTVYDLLQYDGGAPDGGLVRGAIVHGAGVRPPMAIEIEVSGKEVRAVRME